MELTKNQQQIIDLVKEMNAVELNGLVKALEEEFGVTAAAMVVAGGAAAGGAAADAGASDAIKVVKEALGLDLKAAKELVEKAPVIIKENAKADEAEALKTKLTEAGATINFK